MEPLAAEDDCEHLTFNVSVSLFAITKGLAGKRDGLPVLNENSAESSAGGVDLDDTLSLWVEVRKGHFTTDETSSLQTLRPSSLDHAGLRFAATGLE